MNTPVCDFVNEYARKNSVRLHMPGHKGLGLLGFEDKDITEISGADSLYEADGIIKASENNASGLFGCDTFYSTEGSSQCIRAMVYLACIHAKSLGRKPLIAAGRNAHKTFMSACALTDADVIWLCNKNGGSYLSCELTADDIEKVLLEANEIPVAVYLTSPDYLGNIADIKAISSVCKKYGVLLLVDNAHGAYLEFLPESLHPIKLGADICCDSAHKTLPVLTGGAYLHTKVFSDKAKSALSLFGSTSPSYLILQSLDAANKYISDGYKEKLAEFLKPVNELKKTLVENGYTLCGNEPLKITLSTKEYGYFGFEIADLLEEKNIFCEFADKDFIVFMLTPENADNIEKLKNILLSIPKKDIIFKSAPEFTSPEKVMSIKDAVFSESETICAKESEGRILATSNVACPPAVPIVVCGERIDKKAVECFEYYGIENITVIK